jgi:hypothetical protein
MCSSTDAPRFNRMMTGCCWFACSSTDADAGANPSLTTTMSVGPGGTVTTVTPCASVLCGVPFTKTSAAGTGPSSLRTSMRTVAICAHAVAAWSASNTLNRKERIAISTRKTSRPTGARAQTHTTPRRMSVTE